MLVPIVLMATCIAAGELAAQPKTPIPDAQAQQTAKKAAGELFAERLKQAKTTAEKTVLATDMMDAAGRVQAGSADQYVLLKIARDVAAATGDAATALQAVERLLEQFDDSAAELIGDTLLTAARQATTSTQHKAVAEAALSIGEKLADADQYETALRLCEAARSSAQRAKLFPLAKELTARIEETKRQQLLSEDYRKALSVLDDKPTDPAANLAAGRHLCFVKGDWKRGVPMLALGSDAALKAAAIKDLRGATKAEEQAAIGDAWWDLAETKQGEERDMLRLRAGFWYRQAGPKLAEGLVGLKIKQRLADIGKLGSEITMSPQTATSSQAPGPAIAPFDERAAKQHQMLWAKYLKVPVVATNSLGMRMVLIPPGEFEMGSSQEEVIRLLEEARQQNAPTSYGERVPAEAPKHRVKITKPFYLGLCEVTQEQYVRLMGKNPSKFQGVPNRPVEQLDWSNAMEFCRKLSELPPEKSAGAVYRLPTDAEWEYACRAGTTTRYSFGDDAAMLDRYAWFSNNSGGSTQAVGQLRANAFGLFDMHGNVWEWCADWYDPGYYANSPADDPSGPTSGANRLGRGGSWREYAERCRAAYRLNFMPDNRFHSLGFRVSRGLPDR
jgi:formylglycine-generating enzyme required for sulfatase activity